MDKSNRYSTSNRNNPLMPGRVLIAYDANKDRSSLEFDQTISKIWSRGDILHRGDTIVVLGVMQRVLHPLGYQVYVGSEMYFGTHVRLMEEEVSKKVKAYIGMLQQSVEDCQGEGVDIEVKIIAGTPIKNVVVQEVMTNNPTWVILDRNLRREVRSYLRQIPCKVALVRDNLDLEILRSSYGTKDIDVNTEQKLFFAMSKPVPLPSAQENKNTEQSSMSLSYNASMSSVESSDMLKSGSSSFSSKENSFQSQVEPVSNSKQLKSETAPKMQYKYELSSPVIQRQKGKSNQKISSASVLCTACGLRTELYMESMRYSYTEIQLATNDFSSDNLLGEGGYGLVYKGKLQDGQLIAAKVRKEASTQGFSEFHSEVHVLSFARHRNIVMLLGFCCKENVNILVYEYICNKSLEWHLFNNTNHVLEWHRRYAIAIGTAKGLRFLHEECRGSPIIHRDMRPSNILLTHDFVPMLGDFGLAKWKTNEDDEQTRILGTLGYLAPEYAENGIVSVRTDVYAFGIVLIQLMSGRRAVDSKREVHHQSLRQWALQLIRTLALHELIDPRIGDSYNTYELYHIAKTAYLCVQTDPEMRPSMGEVLHLLEGDNDHFQHLAEQFMPHHNN